MGYKTVIIWCEIYENVESPLYAEYKAMLCEAFVPYFGSPEEVENAIYFRLAPQLSDKKRTVYKRPFASLEELQGYLWKLLIRLRWRDKKKEARTCSLDKANEEGLSMKDLLEADTTQGHDEPCHAWMMGIVRGACREKGGLGEVARLIREEPYAGLTQSEMAKRLDCNQATVSRALGELIRRVHHQLER